MGKKTGKSKLKGGNNRRTRRGGQKGGANNLMKEISRSTNAAKQLDKGNILVVRAKDGKTWSNNYYELCAAMKESKDGGINLRLDDKSKSLLTNENMNSVLYSDETKNLLNHITQGWVDVKKCRDGTNEASFANEAKNRDKYYVIGFTKQESMNNSYSGSKFIIVEAYWCHNDTLLPPRAKLKWPNSHDCGATKIPTLKPKDVPIFPITKVGGSKKRRHKKKHRRKSRKR